MKNMKVFLPKKDNFSFLVAILFFLWSQRQESKNGQKVKKIQSIFSCVYGKNGTKQVDLIWHFVIY